MEKFHGHKNEGAAVIETKTQLIESISAGVVSGDLRFLDEARDALSVIRDEEEQEAMQALILDVTELVRQVLKDQEDY